MYKVKINHLETIKKQLVANNKLLENLNQTPIIVKTIKANNKQISLIEEKYYI